MRFRRAARDANVMSVAHASHEILVESISPAIRGTIQDGPHTRERIATGDLDKQATGSTGGMRGMLLRSADQYGSVGVVDPIGRDGRAYHTS